MSSDARLWRAVVGSLALALASALALIVALALGWNSPRPIAAPDWQAPDLPLVLEANPGATVVSLLNHPRGDFVLEVEAIPLSSSALDFNGYGLVYRAQDSANYYAFAVGSDGYYAVLQVVGGAETTLVEWQQFPHVRRGQQINRLRVNCAGPTCRFYVNDEYAATVEDQVWLAGDVGLWVHGFGDEGTVVKFTGVRAWEKGDR
jgi:hypothetical protein